MDTDKKKWAGFGAFTGDDTDIREEMNKIREEMRKQMDDDIEELS